MAGQSRLHRLLIILGHSILVPLVEIIQFLSSQDVLYAPLSDDTTGCVVQPLCVRSRTL